MPALLLWWSHRPPLTFRSSIINNKRDWAVWTVRIGQESGRLSRFCVWNCTKTSRTHRYTARVLHANNAAVSSPDASHINFDWSEAAENDVGMESRWVLVIDIAVSANWNLSTCLTFSNYPRQWARETDTCNNQQGRVFSMGPLLRRVGWWEDIVTISKWVFILINAFFLC
jgi:hypothetical protein